MVMMTENLVMLNAFFPIIRDIYMCILKSAKKLSQCVCCVNGLMFSVSVFQDVVKSQKAGCVSLLSMQDRLAFWIVVKS